MTTETLVRDDQTRDADLRSLFFQNLAVSSRRVLLMLAAAFLICVVPQMMQAQEAESTLNQQSPVKPEAPPPPPQDEPISVVAEEVRLPIVAFDDAERFDPKIEVRDLLVLEDNVPQTIKSLQRLPAHVLLLLDTGGEQNRAMRTSTTRDVALKVIEGLRDADQVAVIQFYDRVEELQEWTTDKQQIAHVLRTKLFSGRRARFSEALAAAASRLKNRPTGNCHVVLVTDGVEVAKGKINRQAAVKQLLETGATVHVVSYTAMARRRVWRRTNPDLASLGRQADSARAIALASIDPSLLHINRGSNIGQGGGSIFSIGNGGMSEVNAGYAALTEQSETQLQLLADETGGRIWLPKLTEEMIEQAAEITRDIAAQYVATYTPQRPLSSVTATEYRRIRLISRRAGLQLRTRPGYTVQPTR